MIKFTVATTSPLSPHALCEQIFDVSHWKSFAGYGPIPGIENARVDNLSEDKIGTRFHVKNTDESTHIETVIGFIPQKELVLRMDNFSNPLNLIASHFIEKWQFETERDQTKIERSFELYPLNFWGSIILKIISIFLKKAVRNHLELMSLIRHLQKRT